MEEKDTYKTIDTPGNETLFKDRNSKFFGFAFPIKNEEEVKKELLDLKKSHHSARHWCYAWRIGTDENCRYRVNDDGEPSNSAGQPIYGQLLSYDVTNVLVVVVRYFGGVKLGVGGLINAYRESASLALQEAIIIEKTINHDFCISFEYKNMNKVMRVIKENNLTITKQDLTLNCKVYIAVRKNKVASIKKIFASLYDVDFKTI